MMNVYINIYRNTLNIDVNLEPAAKLDQCEESCRTIAKYSGARSSK